MTADPLAEEHYILILVKEAAAAILHLASRSYFDFTGRAKMRDAENILTSFGDWV